MLQLDRKHTSRESVLLAWKILEEHMDEFSRKHYEKIKEGLKVSDEELRAAVKEILKLNPRPGNTMHEGQRSSQHIIPDFIMTNNDGKLALTLNSRTPPDLNVS